MGQYGTAKLLFGNPVKSFMERFITHYELFLADNNRPSLIFNSTSIDKSIYSTGSSYP